MRSSRYVTITVAAVLLAATAFDAGARAPEGWIGKAREATAESAGAGERSGYLRGFHYADSNILLLAEAWRSHGAAARRATGLTLDTIAARVAEALRLRPTAETMEEMSGVADRLALSGLSITGDQAAGWNAFMDNSLHWTAAISSESPRAARQTFAGVGGTLYGVHNSARSGSLTAPDEATVRFEVSAGDVWPRDPPSRERSEIVGPLYPQGETLTVTYAFMVEPGAPNTSDWLVMGQFHGADSFRSPPFAVELVGERMAIKVRRLSRSGKVITEHAYLDDRDIERGRYYEIVIRARFAADGSGRLKVWRDGTPIVTYAGAMGYGDGVYWKHGVYRESSAETIAVNIRDLFVSGDGGLILHRRHDRSAAALAPQPGG